MDYMHKIATVIGYGFIFASLIGALVPGMNFHVIFAPDKSAIKGHHDMAKRVEDRLKEKQPTEQQQCTTK